MQMLQHNFYFDKCYVVTYSFVNYFWFSKQGSHHEQKNDIVSDVFYLCQ